MLIDETINRINKETIYLIGDSSYIMQCLKGKELSVDGCEGGAE